MHRDSPSCSYHALKFKRHHGHQRRTYTYQSGMDSGLNAQAVCSNARFSVLFVPACETHKWASWIVVSKFNLTSFSIIVLFIYLYKRTLWCYYFYPVKYSENFQVLLQSYNNNLFFEGKHNFFLNLKKNIVIIAGVWNAAGGTRFQKSLSSETKKCLFWEGSLSFSVKRHGKKVL